MKLSYSVLRQRLAARGLWPRRTLARVTAYVVALDVLLYALARLLGWMNLPAAAASLGGWDALLTFISIVLLLLLGIGWLRRKLMWRLRNRLIVTYVFIGVIPVLLLLSMAGIAGVIFGGQFAVLLATSDLETQLRAVEAANSEVSAGVAARLARGAPVSLPSLEQSATSEARLPGRQVTVWWQGKGMVAPGPDTPLKPPPGVGDEFRTIALDDGRLYLRAGRKLAVGRAGELTVISSVPLGQQLFNLTVAQVGEATLSAGTGKGATGGGLHRQRKDQPAISISVDDSAIGETSVLVKGGALPPPRGRWDTALPFGGWLTVTDWATGDTRRIGLAGNTRLSSLYQRLSASFGKDASIFTTVLIVIAVVLGVVALASLIIGIRLTRTMTRSVHELYRATEHVNRGDFRHRIRVKTRDQLAALETSFNSMTESIEKLLLEQKEKQRLEHELAIAQEVQAQLFPRQVSDLPSLEVHGICRPARTVSGDYYDFLPLGRDRLALAVGDVSGKGISAALLMATIHSAVRAYSLERVPAQVAVAAGDPLGLARVPFAGTDGELSPATLMSMLNRQLYGSTPAEKYATMFLGFHHAKTRKLTYCNAGHLPPIIMGPDGAVRRLDCGGTVIGLFGQPAYDEASIELYPGEILLAYSDGVTEPENEFGEFGEERLIELVRENRDLPLERISEAVLAAVTDWIGGEEQPDDITLVLARAR